MAELRIEYIPIDDLKEWAENPRFHDVGAIRRSMERFGIRWPIIVNRRTMQVEAGHGRLKALRELGEKKAPVLFVEDDDLTAKAFAIADNRTQELTRWDEEGLATILRDLEGKGALADTSFSSDDLGKLLRDLELQNRPIHEPPATTQTPSRVRRGDIWEMGRHRLMCGDATQPRDFLTLLDGEKIDCVFTDPPYGIAYDSVSMERSRRDWGEIESDQAVDLDSIYDFSMAWVSNIQAHSQPHASYYVCFAIQTMCALQSVMRDLGIWMAMTLVWDKTYAPVHWLRYHPQHEVIIYAGEGAKPGMHSRWFGPKTETTIWSIPHETSHIFRLHPTQKPIALVERALHNSTRPGDVVCDPFVGSGTTIIGAEKKAVRCYALEIDPRICDVAIARWERLIGQEAVRVSHREAVHA